MRGLGYERFGAQGGDLGAGFPSRSPRGTAGPCRAST